MSWLSRSVNLFEKNQKSLLIAIGVIEVVGIRSFIIPPTYQLQKKEAQEIIYKGEQYFAADSYQIAENGDGAGYICFEAIIDDYRTN
jgi:hypothetical protein